MNLPVLSSLKVFSVPVILTLSPGLRQSTRSSSKTSSICFGSVPPERFSNGSCILALWVSMYLDSSSNGLNDLPPHSGHRDGDTRLPVAGCSCSHCLAQPLHSNTPTSMRGRISSVLRTIPSAATNLPMYLLSKSLNGMTLVRFLNLMFNTASFMRGSMFLTAFCDAVITSSGLSINKSAKPGSNISRLL